MNSDACHKNCSLKYVRCASHSKLASLFMLFALDSVCYASACVHGSEWIFVLFICAHTFEFSKLSRCVDLLWWNGVITMEYKKIQREEIKRFFSPRCNCYYYSRVWLRGISLNSALVVVAFKEVFSYPFYSTRPNQIPLKQCGVTAFCFIQHFLLMFGCFILLA